MTAKKSSFVTAAKIAFAATAAATLASCASITKNEVANVMPAANDFRSRVESIQPGDSYQTVLGKLQLSTQQFDDFSATMDDSAAYSYIYGDLNPVAGTRVDEYNRLEGFTITYQNVREDTRYNLLNTRTRVSGDSLSTTIIFRDGAVVNDPVVAESEVEQQNNDSHLRRINPLNFIPGM